MHMKNMSKYAFQENALSNKIDHLVLKIEKKIILIFFKSEF